MPDLWVPGFAGPLDDLVDRIHRKIAQVAEGAGAEQLFVEVELVDGVRYGVESIAAEPGYGFVSLRPNADDDAPVEVIVPIGSIKRIELRTEAEERGRLGFSVPSA